MASQSNLQESTFDHDNNTVPSHSRRLSASLDANFSTAPIDQETPKIVEVDTGRPKSRSRRTTNTSSVSDFGDDPAAGSYQAVSSPLPCCRRISVPTPDCHRNVFQDLSSEWGLTGDECRFSTAQSTPRFLSSCGGCGAGVVLNAPATPAKSACAADSGFFRGYGNFPNYMANTQSFKAKLRSYSAPKQRPEPGPKKRHSLTELMESRSSLSGVRMQRSCSQVQEAISFKNAVMGKLEYRDRIV